MIKLNSTTLMLLLITVDSMTLAFDFINQLTTTLSINDIIQFFYD